MLPASAGWANDRCPSIIINSLTLRDSFLFTKDDWRKLLWFELGTKEFDSSSTQAGQWSNHEVLFPQTRKPHQAICLAKDACPPFLSQTYTVPEVVVVGISIIGDTVALISVPLAGCIYWSSLCGPPIFPCSTSKHCLCMNTQDALRPS